MKIILTVLICLCVLMGCGEREYTNTRDLKPNTDAPEPVAETKNPLIANPIVEKAIRESLEKPTGELTNADLEKLEWLETGLRGKQLTEVKGLEKLTQLKTLYLESNQLTSVKGLAKLTQLKQLHLLYNQLTELPKGLEKLTQLEELDLGGNQLNDVSGLEKLDQLTSLNLQSNQLTDVPKGLEKLTQLENLNLYKNKLTDVKGLEKLDQLAGLNLDGNQLTDVKGLEKLTKLTRLDLRRNPDLTKAQIDQLKKALPKCRIYSNPPLTKEESAKVIEAAIRKSLKKPTGDLSKADLEKVTKLDFNSKKLPSVPKGLEKLNHLTQLNLFNNKLTNVKGLEKLTQLKQLHLLYNPALTKAQIDQLQKALPKCKIFSDPTR